MAGIINMASQGRNGDTMMAHMTPGEVVIPKEVAALRPDLVAHVQEGIRRMGGDASKYVAGNGRVNPQTGIEEFATEAEVRAAYQSVLGREPEAAGLKNWMDAPDLSTFVSSAQPELDARAKPVSAPAVSQGYEAAQQAPAVSSPVTQRVIDPDKETVAGQVKGIINENSPLQQLAEARSQQKMNDRGLGNSSLAIGAGQTALYDAAMPIANADANIYGNAATLNTNTQNQFTSQKDATQNQINANSTGAINSASVFGADSSNKASLQNAQIASSDRAAQLSATTQKSIAANNAISQQIISGLNNESQAAIAKLSDQNKEILQTNESSSALHAKAMQTIAGIQADPNITDKAGSINQVLTTLNNSLAIMGLIGNDLDFSSITPTATAAPIVNNPPADITSDIGGGGE